MHVLKSRIALIFATLFAAGDVAAQAPEPVVTQPATTEAAMVPAEAGKEMLVYDTALAPGWQNWSWAKTDLSIELTGSARKPIRVVAGPWQALYLHHEPFSTTGMTSLSLLVQGSAPNGEVRLFATTGDKIVGEGKLVKISNTGWTQVVMPLSALGVQDQMLDGLWVQNASAHDMPKFYVTEIKIR